MAGPPGSPPSPTVNSQQTLQQQQQAGINAAKASGQLSNQSNPFGSLTYSIGPDGSMTANQNYSQPEQALFNMFTGSGGFQPTALTGANTNLGQFLNSTGGNSVSDYIGDQTSGKTGQMVGSAVAGIQPFLDQQRTNTENELANQGLFQSTNTQTPNNAADRAMQNLAAGQSQTIASFESQFEPQAYSQAMQSYLTPEQTALTLGQAGAPTALQGTWAGSPTSQVVPGNALAAQQAQYNQQMQQYNAQAASAGQTAGLIGNIFGSNSMGNMMSGLFGSAGAAGDAGLGTWAADVAPALLL